MTVILEWFLRCSFVAALVIPIVAILCRLFSKRPAIQHALWTIVLLKFVTPSVLVWPWPILNILDSARFLSWTNPYSSPTLAGSPRFERAAQTDAPFIIESWIKSGSAPRVFAAVLALLGAIWLFGALFFALRQCLRLKKQMALIKQAIPAPPGLLLVFRDVANQLRVRPLPVLIVPGIGSPFVWCLGRPKLIWPERMAGEEVATVARSVVAHELAHVRRRDHWITWVQLVAGIIWWWNPLFWYVQRKLTTAAEMACDALALSEYPDERCVYAESLLQFSGIPSRGIPAIAFVTGDGCRSSFERRMRLIVSERVDAKVHIGGILLSAVIAIVITPSWSLGSTEGGGEGPSDAALESESDIAGDREFTIAQPDTDIQPSLAAARDATHERSRATLIDAKRALEHAKAAQVRANKRVEALKVMNEDESRKQELDEADRVLEIAESELEFAEAFHELAAKQMNAVK